MPDSRPVGSPGGLRTARAVAARDLVRAFGNPTGYVFITLFILLSAAAAFWQPRFFLSNLATLDQLTRVFPYVLLAFVPALTMSVWSEEQRLGTDELLFTLPAPDWALVLGKYAAALGVYTFAVVLSLSHAGVLAWLGSPDLGLLAASYAGFWLMGAALIPVGMLASAATANATIAFVLAAAFCALPIVAPGITGVGGHFQDFARGIVSLSGATYFAGLTATALSLNVVAVGRRRRTTEAARIPQWAHQTVRAIAVMAAALALVGLAGRRNLGLDVTVERIHSVSDETRRLIGGLPTDGPVRVQAFVSPDVPAAYVQTRENLLNSLRQIDAIAGGAIDLRIDPTETFTPAARTARDRFGIVPRLAVDPMSGAGAERVFLGVAVTQGPSEQVIPFLDRGQSVEYELVRAIRTVTHTDRRRIGVVDTDARVLGGVDYATGRTRPSWAIVDELARQYDVVAITPWEPITELVDVLLVVLPSTLLQQELDHVVDAVRRGIPALVIVDPLPAFDMRLAPAAAMGDRANPYAVTGAALSRKNTGDIQSALRSIGVSWSPTRVGWDTTYRPSAAAAQLPEEVVFAGVGSGSADALHVTHPATAGLQQLMLMYPGAIAPADDTAFTFQPLVRSGRISGTHGYFEIVQPTPVGPTLNPSVRHEPDGDGLTLAAHVRSSGPSSSVNAVVIADLDFITDSFFAMRAQLSDVPGLDNIAFFLNAIDTLAGDEALIALRSRSPRHRTLERVEAETRAFVESRAEEDRRAAADAEAALDQARLAMDARVAAIETRTDLDAQARAIVMRNAEAVERRKLEVLQAAIEQARDTRIQASRETMESAVRAVQRRIRSVAVVLPPLPVGLLGLVVLLRRRRLAREAAVASGRLRTS